MSLDELKLAYASFTIQSAASSVRILPTPSKATAKINVLNLSMLCLVNRFNVVVIRFNVFHVPLLPLMF